MLEKTNEINNKPAIRPQLLDRFEGAAFCGVSVPTLDRAVKDKKISCVRIGRRVLFRQTDLENFIARNVVAAKG